MYFLNGYVLVHFTYDDLWLEGKKESILKIRKCFKNVKVSLVKLLKGKKQ